MHMNKNLMLGVLVRLASVALVLDGCGSVTNKSTTNDGGSAGSVGSAGNSAGAGTTGGAGKPGSAGTSGGAGTTGSAGMTGAAGTTGSAGTNGNGGVGGAPAGCGANGSACTTGGFTGLCESMVCGPCTDTTDDLTCTAAYGSASKPYLCLSGICTPGNCRTDTDCAGSAAGTLCGPTTPNVCGPCTTDSQCSADNAATPVCNATTGKCVAGTCTPGTTNPPAACSVNAGDVCCTTNCQAGPPSGGVACCPTADSTTYCTTKLGMAATCSGNVCTACPAVTDGNYTVDPVNGKDTTGTGSGAQAGCAFKTITRALAVIGTPTLATSITVLGPSTVGANETFPIVLPAKLTLTTGGGAVTVNVPSGDNGFTLNSAGTAVTGATGAPLTISGQNQKATTGISAFGKSTAATTISNVTVSGFLDYGIDVGNNAVLTIGPGVKSTGNTDGLLVHVSGHVVIDVPAGSATTSFDSNSNYGINVLANANLTLTGSVTSATAGTGTVTTNKNAAFGLYISQTPGTPPQNVIDGLVSFGNKSAGIGLAAGSNVQLRNSVTLGNSLQGITVGTNVVGASIITDISKIDLGSATSPGLNTVQDAAGGAVNSGAGICLDLPSGAAALSALGNIFGSTNCSTTAGKLTINKSSCVSSCAGSPCDLGVSEGNDIAVKQCTHP
jgi:collagen type VII alpha